MEERTEYDQEVTCQHSYNKRCAKSLVTVYKSQQEEECEENFVKNCFIEYSKHAVNVTARVCRLSWLLSESAVWWLPARSGSSSWAGNRL